MIDEKIKAREIKRKNERLYPIYKMFGVDFVFYYAIEFLFLTQIKQISASNVIFAGAIYSFFRIITQIPGMIIVEKIGKRNGILLGNFCNVIYILLIISCKDVTLLIIAQLFCATAFSFKGICEPGILEDSIPNFRKKSDIFSKLDSMGLSWYYYFAAFSSAISGFLFAVNPYIPMILCLLFTFISFIISIKFKEPTRIDKFSDSMIPTKKRIDKYYNDLKQSFTFIFKSKRLKGLIMFSGVFYGIISLMGSFEISLLSDLKVSSVALGIIMAILGCISGLASKSQNKFHKTYKNRSLGFISYTFIMASIVASITVIFGMPQIVSIVVIFIMYGVRYVDKGLFNVLMTKYLGNFSNSNITMKIYSTNSLIQNICRTVFVSIGAVVLSFSTTANSMFLFGMIFIIIISFVLVYMKTRVGLKPEEYNKEDIEYKNKL